jgi:hypothetical protein
MKQKTAKWAPCFLIRRALMSSVLVLVILSLAAYEKKCEEGPAERAGKQVDKAMDQAGQAMDKAKDTI